jgi:tetratricopeptide (TPR) repeat protein
MIQTRTERRLWEVCSEAAQIAQMRGDYVEAEQHFVFALVSAEQELGPRNEQVARALIDLADFYVETKKIDQAEKLYRRALMLYEDIFGKENLVTGMIYRVLAEVCFQDDRPQEAFFLRARARHILEHEI